MKHDTIDVTSAYLMEMIYLETEKDCWNLQSMFKKKVMNSIEECPVLWCSTVYKKKCGGGRWGGGGATGIMKWILVVQQSSSTG